MDQYVHQPIAAMLVLHLNTVVLRTPLQNAFVRAVQGLALVLRPVGHRG